MKDEKGMSPVIGFTLILSIIVLSLALTQSVYVPEWNKAVEANHYRDLRSSILQLGDKIIEVGRSDTSLPITLDLSPEYPTRAFLFNPLPPTGSVRVERVGKITMSCEVLNPNGSVGYINISEDDNFYAADLIIEPGYLYLGKVGFIFEYFKIFEKWNDNLARIANMGDELRIIVYNGSSTSGDTISIDVCPIAAGGGLYVRNGTITLPLSNDTFDIWRKELVNGTFGANYTFDESNHTVTIHLNNDWHRTSIWVVGIHGCKEEFPTVMLATAKTDNGDVYVLPYGTIQLGVKIQDIFGNPVAGEEVKISTSIPDLPVALTTDENGVVEVEIPYSRDVVNKYVDFIWNNTTVHYVIKIASNESYSGMLAYWRFDEGSGTTARDSTGISGNLYVYYPQYARWVSGHIDDAITGTNTANFAANGSVNYTSSKSFSVEFWGKINLSSTSGKSTARVYFVDANNYSIYTAIDKSRGQVSYNLVFEVNFSSVSANTTIVEDCWMYVVCTYNSTTQEAKMYINGILAASSSINAGDVSPSGWIKVARAAKGNQGQLIYSYVDELRIYERELTENDVMMHFLAELYI